MTPDDLLRRFHVPTLALVEELGDVRGLLPSDAVQPLGGLGE